MEPASDPEFLVLHGLRIKGFAEASVVAEVTGLDPTEVARQLGGAAQEALALRREGRISGWTLTPDGRARHAELLAADLDAAGCREALHGVYPRFGELNTELKSLCTEWQMRDGALNDHADRSYDLAVIGRLRTFDERVQPLCGELSAHLPRLAHYGPRLRAAVDRVSSGDTDGFTRPLANSYHDIWMELHEDLIASLGLARTAADA